MAAGIWQEGEKPVGLDKTEINFQLQSWPFTTYRHRYRHTLNIKKKSKEIKNYPGTSYYSLTLVCPDLLLTFRDNTIVDQYPLPDKVFRCSFHLLYKLKISKKRHFITPHRLIQYCFPCNQLIYQNKSDTAKHSSVQ